MSRASAAITAFWLSVNSYRCPEDHELDEENVDWSRDDELEDDELDRDDELELEDELGMESSVQDRGCSGPNPSGRHERPGGGAAMIRRPLRLFTPQNSSMPAAIPNALANAW
jgi:hypothetical protein